MNPIAFEIQFNLELDKIVAHHPGKQLSPKSGHTVTDVNEKIYNRLLFLVMLESFD